MLHGDGHKLVNWPIKPFSTNFKAKLMKSCYTTTLGISSSFLTNNVGGDFVFAGRSVTKEARVLMSGEEGGGGGGGIPSPPEAKAMWACMREGERDLIEFLEHLSPCMINSTTIL
jgi:hypothetical protein